MITQQIGISKNIFPPVSNGKSRKITWQDFQKRYLSKEDGYKYEWVDGFVIKSKHMDYNQFFIIRNLLNFFEQLKHQGKTSGLMMLEGDIFFGGNHRRPDLAYLTDLQIDRTAYGVNQIPQFVTEVISTKDQMNLVHLKMQDYRSARVSVVWHIFPLIEQVHIYSGPDLKRMEVCSENDVCSAAPVIPGFEMTANAIFKKPPMPE